MVNTDMYIRSQMMPSNLSKPLKILAYMLVLTSMLLIIQSVFAGSASADAYQDAYEKMNQRLPDDDYTLYKNGNPVGSSADCQVKWGCTTGNYSFFNNASDASSHQYITLGNRSINDDPSVPAAAAYRYANSTELVMYTYGQPSTNRNFRIQVVDRGIGEPLACHNTITAFYYDALTNDERSSTIADTGCDGTNFADVPKEFFREITYNGGTIRTNIYRAKIVLRYGSANGNDNNKPNSQISFHVTTNFARLGYYGGDSPKLPMSKGAEHGWVNAYPTNYARKNKMRFYFRPTCSTAKGSPFSVEWDDVNTDNSSIQPEGGVAVLYKYKPGNIGSRQVVSTYSNLGSGYQIRSENTDNYGAGNKQPYAYMLEFDGIYGGNGISFRYPFNSADARIECPADTTSSTPKSECNQFTYRDPGQQIPPDGTVNRDTNSVVHITDSRGKVLVNGAVNWSPPTKGGYLGENEQGTWDYTPTGETVHIKVTTRYKTVDGSGFIAKTNVVLDADYTCYKPTCGLSVYGDGPNGIVLAGGTAHITGTIYNPDRDGANPDLLDLPNTPDGSRYLSVTSNGVEHRIGSGIGLDSSDSASWDIPALGGVGTQTIDAYPDFYGIGSIGPGCPTSFPVYQYFEIRPSASLSGNNWENPTTVKYETCGEKITGPDISASSVSTLTRNGVGAPPQNANDVYGSTKVCHQYPYNPTVINAGDEYCASVTITYGKGYKGPTDIVAGEQVQARTNPCPQVHNSPYVHLLGSDVSAGGAFGKPCESSNGGIYTYLNTTGFNQGAEPGSGSGVQIGALAIGPINGFNSANLRGSAPTSANGLAFANDIAVGSGPGDPAVGGSLGGSHCMTDYWSKMPAKLKEDGPVNQDNVSLPSTNGKGKQVAYYKPASGTLRLNNGTIGKGKNVAIFVEGNLRIGGDGSTTKVQYGDTTWGSIDEIPSLYFIVKGNIYIDAEVTQLDGVYIAQPNGGSGGNIYTCTDETSPISVGNSLSQCGKQLVVNGAFVAQKVHLLRSFGSLRNSYPGEKLQLGGARTCAVNTSTGNTTTGDCASEIFNFSPEMYLQAPDIQATSGPNTGKYDYITSLSPVL
jgi:hypothetical protein